MEMRRPDTGRSLSLVGGACCQLFAYVSPVPSKSTKTGPVGISPGHCVVSYFVQAVGLCALTRHSFRFGPNYQRGSRYWPLLVPERRFQLYQAARGTADVRCFSAERQLSEKHGPSGGMGSTLFHSAHPDKATIGSRTVELMGACLLLLRWATVGDPLRCIAG